MAEKRRKAAKRPPDNTAIKIGHETQLWHVADALRSSMDAAEYEYVVLGPIVHAYISGAFPEKQGVTDETAKGFRA